MRINTLKYRKGNYSRTLTERVIVSGKLVRPPRTLTLPFATFHTSGQKVVDPGYAWDGASGPTIDTDSVVVPAFNHDLDYQFIREGGLGDTNEQKEKYRKLADMDLRLGMKRYVDTLHKKWYKQPLRWWGHLRAEVWYIGVRFGAGWAADPARKRKPKEMVIL